MGDSSCRKIVKLFVSICLSPAFAGSKSVVL
jgi:hypothetical protein